MVNSGESQRTLVYSSNAAACRLQALCEALQRRGHAASVAVYSIAGDIDVRIQVCDADGDEVLELLGPSATSADRAVRWDAVCIAPDGPRALCRGPLQCCSDAAFVDFVEDLLARGGCADRYARLV